LRDGGNTEQEFTMPERTSYASGTPNWIDLQTSDPSAAKQFYGALFGWSYDDQAIPEAPGVFYSMAQRRGKNVAGIAPLPDAQVDQGVPPHWNSYVSVDDLDATLAKVGPAGGTVVMPPFDISDSGRMAVVQDPTGAVIALWQAKEHIGASLVNEPGTFCWSELITPDIPAAAAFYRAVFGWDAATTEGDMPYTEFKLGESIAGGMNPPMPGIPPMWGIYIAVDDTDATVSKTTELGGSVIAPATDIEPGRFAVLADPQGAMFSVIKMHEA
jgi:predicted enzyme related to lactoylglutathione lyase